MKFIRSLNEFPFSSAVVHSGNVLETVLTGTGADGKPVPGGPAAELREIFRQLDEILAEVGLDKTHVCSARIYLHDVLRDVAEMNDAYGEYFGSHPPCRRCYGVTLQAGMLVEAAFTAEFPPE